MTNEELKAKIEFDFKDAVQTVAISAQKEVVVTVSSANYVLVCKQLRDRNGYEMNHLSCLTAVDYPKENKMTVVSHLWSYKNCFQLTVKMDVDRANPRVPTLFDVWNSANWFEREVFDLYGVVFEGHPNLRRIMMPDDYQKFPLRKDFSDDGFIVKPS
jgi:NADH-quinone oxidoreductase subunit C